MCHKISFNPYSMTGKTRQDDDYIIVFMAELDEELTMDEKGTIETLSGEYVAQGKIVGIGNGICC
jgi:hypothetical protein